jgi:ATP sulfurylase
MLEIKMDDGSVWAVPVMEIARNRAEEYAHEFGGDVELSLKEDTIPLFELDEYEIIDWAAGNMNWSDVKDVAVCIKQPNPNYQNGWVNGTKKVTK